MSTRGETHDEAADVQAVMGDYFAALLHEPAQVPAPSVAAVPVANSVIEAPLPTAAPEPTAPGPSYQLIHSGGLTFGIPTHAIAEIVAAPPQWTPLNDARAEMLGAYRVGEESFAVVDTAKLLVPGATLQCAGASVVLLAGQRIALACDGIGEQLTPDPAQITWRSAQGKRAWLAGTLRSPACALLDIPELVKLLNT